MALGRPTAYDPETISHEVERYVKLCKSESYLPTVEGLAVHLCVARSTIYKWAEEHPDFSDILEQLLAAQAK
jgi:hypothetical protein